MRIAFFSSDAISINALEFLKQKDLLACVVSNPDKPKGRGKALSPNAVSEWALKNNIKLLRPEKVLDDSFFDEVKDIDLFLVMAYGNILKEKTLKFPKLGCLNLHASLLPKLRGASPIETAIALGFKQTGCCLMQMEKTMDTGAVGAVEIVDISNEDTGESLRKKISVLAKNILEKNLEDIKNQNFLFIQQKHAEATYARKLNKSDMFLDFRKSASELDSRIRAFGAGLFEYNNEVIKILKSKAIDSAHTFEVGRISQGKDFLRIYTKESFLEVEVLQRPCQKPLAITEFLCGFKFEENTILKSADNAPLLK